MTESRTIEVEPIGPVLFARSKRAKRISITIKPDRTVRVTVPAKASFKTARKFLQSKIQWAATHLAALKHIDRTDSNIPAIDLNKARTILIARLELLAQRHGFKYNKVSIRNQKTRWGSCSAKNNISLNIKLLTLPQELMDYVILHELVHTVQKNHSKKFWTDLTNLLPTARELNKQIKTHTPRLIPPLHTKS